MGTAALKRENKIRNPELPGDTSHYWDLLVKEIPKAAWGLIKVTEIPGFQKLRIFIQILTYTTEYQGAEWVQS